MSSSDWFKFQSLIGQLQTWLCVWTATIPSSFNPLQVSYKRLGKKATGGKREKFQSLIGQLQTKLYETGVCGFFGVSIPYRLATNTRLSSLSSSSSSGFQSLIGQLQTSILLGFGVMVGGGFNPLQVSYKPKVQYVQRQPTTRVSIPYRLATNRVINTTISLIKNGFQSLIGQLQTETFFPVLSQLLVSIPYRLATNHRRNLLYRQGSVVSIPYRLATNSLASLIISSKLTWFQSLIGQLQTGYGISKTEMLEGFQSLIGQLQTCFILTEDILCSCFNPLQVSYKLNI